MVVTPPGRMIAVDEQRLPARGSAERAALAARLCRAVDTDGLHAVAADEGLCAGTVRMLLWEADYWATGTHRGPAPTVPPRGTVERDELAARMRTAYEAGDTVQRCAEHWKVPYATTYGLLREAGTTLRPLGPVRKIEYLIPGPTGMIRVSREQHREWKRQTAAEQRAELQRNLAHDYVHHHLSIRALIRKYHSSYGLVRNLLLEKNVTLRARGTPPKTAEHHNTDNTE